MIEKLELSLAYSVFQSVFERRSFKQAAEALGLPVIF